MISIDTITVLQGHIYNILNSNADFKSVCKVYEEVPQDTCFPYAEIGEFDEIPERKFGEMSEIISIIDIFDSSPGNKKILGISSIITDILKSSGNSPSNNGYQILLKKIEKRRVEKLFDETKKQLLRHMEIHASFSLVEAT